MAAVAWPPDLVICDVGLPDVSGVEVCRQFKTNPETQYIPVLLITGLAEILEEFLTAFGLDIPGVKRVFYGLCLLVVVMILPHGIWPPLARRLGVGK